MRRYMIQIKYSELSASGLVKNPQNRKPQAEQIMTKLNGLLVDFYFTFGDWDALIIVELPSDIDAMAVAMADVAGGVGATKVTPLYEMEEALTAMKKANAIDYLAPQ